MLKIERKYSFCGKKYIFAVMIRADANKGVTHCGGISGHLVPRKLQIVSVTFFTKGLMIQTESIFFLRRVYANLSAKMTFCEKLLDL